MPCSPTLTAEAGDSKATLTWKLGESQIPISGWRYRQSVRGESGAAVHTIKTLGNSHVVQDLMNGVIYMFRVQAVLESGGFGCWSDPTPAVPGKLGEVVERIEKHQEAIVWHTSAIVDGIAANGEILQGIAASAKVIALESADISDGVGDVADGVEDVASGVEDVASGVRDVASGVEDVASGVRDVADGARDVANSVNVAGNRVACGLAGVAAQLNRTRDGECCEAGKDGKDRRGWQGRKRSPGWQGWKGWKGWKMHGGAKRPEPVGPPDPLLPL